MTESVSPGSFPAFNPLPGRGGSPIPISGASVRIGQGPQNDVVIDDDTVSTSHARLDYLEGSWRLSDLGSRNGTFVSGERVPAGGAVELSNGATVAFGGVKLVFEPGSGAPAPAASVPVAAPSVPLAARPRFRLPVWLLLVIILVIATIITLVIVLGGALEPTAFDVTEVILLLGFQTDHPEP